MVVTSDMITPIQNSLYNYTPLQYKKQPKSTNNTACKKVLNLNNLPFYKNQISFGQSDEEKIRKYMKKIRLKHTRRGVTYKNIDLYNTKKLEGIQKDIDVFKGLSMEQIKFISKHSTEFVLQRGCHNMCAHCYAKAMPPSYQKMPDKINKIDFEDFEKLYYGFKELNKRLGFSIFKSAKNDYNTLFHDADSSTIFLQDKNGKVYDYLDLGKMVHELTDKTVLFDTAGWNIQDKKTQKRMEELVKKAASSDEYDFMEFNISTNPFHALNYRALQHLKNGDYEKYDKFRDIYTTRMANVLFTFTPLIEKEQVNLLARALPNETRHAKGYREDDLLKLYSEVFIKLLKLYKQDYESGAHKVIKDEEQINKNLDYLNKKLKKVDKSMGINGRLADIVTDKKIDAYKATKERTYANPHKAVKAFTDGLIDLNGKLYVMNWYETYPTDIQLNYKNKDKITAPIHPSLNEQKITSDMLEDLDNRK